MLSERWNVFEILLVVLGAIAATVCFTLFEDRSILAYITAVLVMLGNVALWKHAIIAPGICSVYTLLYAFITVIVGYFGELFFNVFVMLFVYSITQVVFIRKYVKQRGVEEVKVAINKISFLETIIFLVLLAGATFLSYKTLSSLATEQLILNVVSIASGIAAVYLMLRSWKYYDILYFINHIVSLILWILSLPIYGMIYLPLVIAFAVVVIYDIYRFFNRVFTKKVAVAE